MSNERIIRIFIGSSITDLELERMKLMSFIQGLNNKYHERGVFIEGYACEETPNAMRVGSSQQMHNDYISGNADATIFMFFHKAGEFTMEELGLARQAFLEKGRPNVYVFFKAVDGAPDVSDGIQRAVRLVFEEYRYYYKMFDDVDTVKLELLQFLLDMLPSKGELVIRNGAVYMDGELVRGISAANVYAYQNNPNLKGQRAQIESLRELELDSAEKGDEASALRFSKSRGELEKQYYELEADILDALLFFFEENKKGESDPVLAEALRQLELGNITMAKALIPQEALDGMAQSIANRRALMEASLRKEEETLLSRTRARVNTLKLDLENKDRFSEIRRAYEGAYETAKNVRDYDFIYDYAVFMHVQKDYPKAIEIAEKLRHFYDDPDVRGEITNYNLASLLNLLGILYEDNNSLQKAESVYLESLKLWRSIFETEPASEIEVEVAGTCNNLGNLYNNTGRPVEAEGLYLEALETNRHLAEDVNHKAYEPDLAMSCNNLATLYRSQGRPVDAEGLYLEALETYRCLAEDVSHETYDPYVAGTCNNLGTLYANNGRPADAEGLYLEALGLRRRLAETVSRETYEPDVAATCNNLGTLYADIGRATDAEGLLLEALESYGRLAETVSREVYEPEVATACNNLGNFYVDNGRQVEAEALYLEALGLRRHLAETVSREAYEPYVAVTCDNLGTLYANNGRPADAEGLYLEALGLRRRLAETVSRETYEPDVAATCNNLGTLYADIGRATDAEGLLLEALESYGRLAENVSREAYEPYVARTLFNMGILYTELGKVEKSESCFAKAKAIASRYKDVSPHCRRICE